MKLYCIKFWILVPSLLLLGFTKSTAQGQIYHLPANVNESCLDCNGSNWLNMPNVELADDTFATTVLAARDSCSSSACFVSHGMLATNYNFSIPANVTITGFEVLVKRKSSSVNAIRDSSVRLVINDTVITGTNHATTAYWSTTVQNHVYGGPTDLWGGSWTPSQINSPAFGAFLQITNYDSLPDTAFVDDIEISVFYSDSALQQYPAAFSASDSLICIGDTIQFFDQTEGGDTARTWNFVGGSPTTSTILNPIVAYAASGSYAVTLDVRDSAGYSITTKYNYIKVYSPPATPTISLFGDTLISSSATGNQWSLKRHSYIGSY